ncbi:serine/threonine protein kinase [Actinomadura graeca]|uniref:Serine/threonine protein kinase n=1 Tax=Actinomadura graeca TaxID=2750812 RepID=A0ABX8QWR8_9ACTN|nr:serine/threonine-protein kinase [Actinomadura graeca]QXJ22177.1 serine/threonine protein kinase [Actinomadura graeca]
MTGEPTLFPSSDRLGDYEIVETLGEGGMGTVYRARTPDGTDVAVKVIKADLRDSPELRARFRQEVEAAQRVEHLEPIARILGSDLLADPAYIVMEYVDGIDLDSDLAERGPLRWTELKWLALGLASALGAVHKAGVVHRDLKPKNILLTRRGPKIIDFGIAQVLTSQKRTASQIGTVPYMAPEVWQNEVATPASDVFAWGCLMVFAGTGHQAFEGETSQQVAFAIVYGEPRLDGLHDGIRPLVERALAKNPKDRPTAHEITARLYGDGQADSAEVAAKAARRNLDRTSQWLLGTFVLPRIPDLPGPRRNVALAVGAGVGALVLLASLLVWAVLDGGAYAGKSPPRTAGERLYLDRFDNTGSGWVGGTWTARSVSGYHDGRYRVSTHGSHELISFAPMKKLAVPSSTSVSVSATQVSGPATGWFGLFCFGPRATAAYSFLMKSDGSVIELRKQRYKLAEARNADLYRRPGAVTMAISCQASGRQTVRLRLWVGGRLRIDTVDDGQPLTGRTVGVAVSNEGALGRDPLVVDFDDFEIRRAV